MSRIRRSLDINNQINALIRLGKFFYFRVPVVGKFLSLTVDRFMLMMFGIDLYTFSINVAQLSIPHPSGVLLGGNGVRSDGRVVIMGGVSLAGRRPTDPEYLERHKDQSVFVFGDNVVIATGSILIGPLTICDDVTIGPLSLVNKSITEPGVYLGNPARRVSSRVTDEFVVGLPIPARRL